MASHTGNPIGAATNPCNLQTTVACSGLALGATSAGHAYASYTSDSPTLRRAVFKLER